MQYLDAVSKMTAWTICVHFQGKSLNITVIHVYAPTTNAKEAERFYHELQDLLELAPKKDIFFNIGDWNEKVGSQEITGITGKFVLGVQNQAGQRLTEFCQEKALVIANIVFQQHKRWLYTWTSPDGQNQNQIDYILCSWRWQNSIQSAKTRPGADCGSDHELLTAKCRLKLNIIGKTARPFMYDLNQIPWDYTVKVTERFKWLDPRAWRTVDGGSWYCTGGSDQDHSQEKEMQKGKMVIWRSFTKSWEANVRGKKER